MTRASHFYRRVGKRWLDVVVSIVALVLLAPVWLLIAGLVRIKLGSPVLFRHERAGLHGRPFVLMKFRTMHDWTGPDGMPLPDGARLPRLGALLRSTTLDELPELVNILRGDMSLVGPRPLPVRYLGRYSSEQARRHDVKPGLTGWAQINGRNAISWPEKFTLDLWYVDHGGFWVDVKTTLLTVARIVSRAGIGQPGHATMEEFRGTSS